MVSSSVRKFQSPTSVKSHLSRGNLSLASSSKISSQGGVGTIGHRSGKRSFMQKHNVPLFQRRKCKALLSLKGWIAEQCFGDVSWMPIAKVNSSPNHRTLLQHRLRQSAYAVL